MSDEIREFLHEAAGPRESAPFEVETLVRRSRRRRVARAAAGAVVVVAVAAAVSVVDLPLTGPIEPVIGPAPEPTVATSDQLTPDPVEPGEAVLRFTFTGAEGRDGCRYDGPSRLIAGQHRIEFVDTTEAGRGAIGIEPLAEGYGLEDFVASLQDAAGRADPGAAPPYRLDRRTEYDWRPEPSTSYGLEGLRIVQGPDIDLDEISLSAGTHAMYCALQLEDPQVYDLWPVGELAVVEGP